MLHHITALRTSTRQLQSKYAIVSCHLFSCLALLSPAFSCPAILCPALSCLAFPPLAISMVRHFHVLHFQSLRVWEVYSVKMTCANEVKSRMAWTIGHDGNGLCDKILGAITCVLVFVFLSLGL